MNRKKRKKRIRKNSAWFQAGELRDLHEVRPAERHPLGNEDADWWSRGYLSTPREVRPCPLAKRVATSNRLSPDNGKISTTTPHVCIDGYNCKAVLEQYPTQREAMCMQTRKAFNNVLQKTPSHQPSRHERYQGNSTNDKGTRDPRQ